MSAIEGWVNPKALTFLEFNALSIVEQTKLRDWLRGIGIERLGRYDWITIEDDYVEVHVERGANILYFCDGPPPVWKPLR